MIPLYIFHISGPHECDPQQKTKTNFEEKSKIKKIKTKRNETKKTKKNQNDEKCKKMKTEKKPEGSPSLLSAIAGVTVYDFSDSVLCLVKMRHNPVESWKKQIQWYSDTNFFSELSRIDGKSMESEWKIFPGFTTAGILNEIQ